MIKEHRSAGGVLINQENKVYLIYKISRDEWLLPKGTIEKGEKVKDTAIREVHEETGYTDISLIKEDPIATTEFSFVETDTKMTVNKYVTYFLFRLSDSAVCVETPQMVNEGLKGGWFTFENAIKKVAFDELKTTLSKAEILSF